MTWAGPAGPSPDLAAGRVTAARMAADQLTAAELTAAQVTAARLGPAEAAGGWPAAGIRPHTAQSGAAGPAVGRAPARHWARHGPECGRGRHAGGPARPEADPGAAAQQRGRARPRGW